MKKSFWSIFLFVFSGTSFFVFSPTVLAEVVTAGSYPYTSTFVVTGYYSPLPAQERYVTGTYEGDIRLNGEGVHAADGTVVFPGMIASPRDIPFGTKIFIPDLGMGEVHDRGGAINGNRLDVWMGHGDEGLKRALWWGIREVSATVYGPDPSKSVELNVANIPQAKDAGLFVRTRYFRHDLALGDQGGEVEELQRLLKQLGYFPSEISGFYGEETKRAVLQFQVEQKILQENESFGAGHFGPRTRSKFESVLGAKLSEINFPNRSLQFGDGSEEVKAMQTVLKLLGYVVEPTGNFDESTADAVFQFQRKNGIVLQKNETGASIIGPRTRDTLKEAFRNYWIPRAEKLELPDRQRTSSQLVVFQKDLKLGDRGEEVSRLQEELKRLHFLRVEPTAFFGKVTEHAVFKFQQAMEIVDTVKDPGAGLVGPKTKAKIHELIAKREEQNKLIVQKTEKQKAVAEVEKKDRELIAALPPDSAHALAASQLSYGDTSEEVRKLQELLKGLGYFPGHITSDYFGDLTREALIKFQMSHGLVDSEDDSNAGVLNQSTKEKLTKLVQG